MTFEFDPAKSKANKLKHRIDFEEAQELWAGPVVEVPSASVTEERWLVIGQITGRSWTAIMTRRGDNIRIISVRRSHTKEEELYEKIQSDLRKRTRR